MARTLAYPIAMAAAWLATPAMADWVSVAVNRGKGVYGFSAVGADRKVTMDAAVIVCNRRAKRKEGCFPVLSSEQCLAVAKAGVQIWALDGPTVEDANAAALEACRPVGGDRCEIARTPCAN